MNELKVDQNEILKISGRFFWDIQINFLTRFEKVNFSRTLISKFHENTCFFWGGVVDLWGTPGRGRTLPGGADNWVLTALGLELLLLPFDGGWFVLGEWLESVVQLIRAEWRVRCTVWERPEDLEITEMDGPSSWAPLERSCWLGGFPELESWGELESTVASEVLLDLS